MHNNVHITAARRPSKAAAITSHDIDALNYTTKQLYVKLFSKKYDNPEDFFNAISSDQEHHFWGAAREVAKEILSRKAGESDSWSLVCEHLDIFANCAQDHMQPRLQLWLFRAQLGVNALSTHLCNVEASCSWLFDRFLSEVKNATDPNRKNYISRGYLHTLLRECGTEVEYA